MRLWQLLKEKSSTEHRSREEKKRIKKLKEQGFEKN